MESEFRNRAELLSFQQVLTLCAVYELGGYLSGAEKALGSGRAHDVRAGQNVRENLWNRSFFVSLVFFGGQEILPKASMARLREEQRNWPQKAQNSQKKVDPSKDHRATKTNPFMKLERELLHMENVATDDV